jgi:hypothetical protein
VWYRVRYAGSYSREKVVKSVRYFKVVSGRGAIYRYFRDRGVRGVEISGLFEQLPSLTRVSTKVSEAVFIIESLSLPYSSVVEVPMSFVIGQVLRSRVRE